MIENVMKSDAWNINGIERAIRNNKVDVTEYLISIKEIRQRYNYSDNEEESKKLIWRFLFWIFCEAQDKRIWSIGLIS